MAKDAAVALGLMALAGLYWLAADQIRVSRLEGIVGAQAVPKGLAVTLAVLAALLIVQSLVRARQAAVGPADEEGGAGGWHAHLRAAGMLLIGMGYLAVVGAIGYLPAVAALVLATALYLGRRLSAQLAAIAAGLAVLYYLIFVRLLGIPLPPGVWPDLWRALAG